MVVHGNVDVGCGDGGGDGDRRRGGAVAGGVLSSGGLGRGVGANK